MALPSSGAISLNNVNVELGNSGTAYITMGSAAVRGLFGVASGAISMSQGYGASSFTSSDRAMVASGASTVASIDYFTISSTGNAAYFGSIIQNGYGKAPASNGTRGVWAGGYAVYTTRDQIEYITIASTGNATFFGTTVGTGSSAGCARCSFRG